MALFEEAGGGSSSKKKKWIMIGIGTALIAIFLVIRNSMRASQDSAASTTADQQATNPTITDTGSYPSDSFGGGISGTGMDQTLATYLAIADQNTAVQMGALNDTLKGYQDNMNTSNAALQAQITAINAKSTATNLNQAPQLPVTTTPASTAHPTPAAPTTYISHVVKKGETISGIATAQYGKQPAYAKGIAQITSLNKLSNPNKIAAGQTIKIPTKL